MGAMSDSEHIQHPAKISIVGLVRDFVVQSHCAGGGGWNMKEQREWFNVFYS